MAFTVEAEFEAALIHVLSQKGWETTVLKHPTEQDLLKNWATILFENNRQIDRLGDYPLTSGEIQQVIEQIAVLRTPVKLNNFINGKTISITRDNPDDVLHFGKEISLKIYDRQEIAAGQSRYQIVQQPLFPTKSALLNDRRGDLMLLINGMPVIHLELKRSGIPVSQAYHQIEKYAGEGIFTGLFSLIQIFVAMNPEEAVYFANPGPDGKFNPDYYFHWADFNNEPINDWKSVASDLLSIPMAHQLIGFYTVADKSDGVLKVMRSYQYYAASRISDRVAKTKWDEGNQRGGYIWHTTGSGKTMTSFKSAQLIAHSNDADKVIFLTDRIELGTQSFDEYNNFAGESEAVQQTENTAVLIARLKSASPLDTLIVTSIQKMSMIHREADGLQAHDLKKINSKRLVFIVDEAHRSTFGEMLTTIKSNFPNALFFGFTGTPIQKENEKKSSTTLDVFGDELHRYSIADGIRDKNVLGFNPCKVLTYKDSEVRQKVAIDEARAKSLEEALSDKAKSEIYYRFMDPSKMPMAGFTPEGSGRRIKGVEDYLPNVQYRTEAYRAMVLKDIGENWTTLSRNGEFHAIFATSSIPEAIAYYRQAKAELPQLRMTCLFDPTIDNNGDVTYKEDGLVEILEDYNARYDQQFTLATHGAFKKDVAARLAHKRPYEQVARTAELELDMLIVVDQMLTGFDSKWVNTLYLDKVMEYENVIQAFSRTNRLYGPHKPFGTVRYYRRPHTMEQNIAEAVKLYSGDKPLALFVDKLPSNLKVMDAIFTQITELFKQSGVESFEKLPDDLDAKAKFASLFKEFNTKLEAAKVQGFDWDAQEYPSGEEGEAPLAAEAFGFDQTKYLTLAQRYKELKSTPQTPACQSPTEEAPFDLVGYLTEIDTGLIDANYMNSRFTKYLKLLHQEGAETATLEQALNELHATFATLSQEEQRYAKLFLHDVQSGDVTVDESKTLRDYIAEYQRNAKNDQIHKFAIAFGLNEPQLREMMSLNITEANINEFGRYDELKKTFDKACARAYFERAEGRRIPPLKVNILMDKLLRSFILRGGYELEAAVSAADVPTPYTAAAQQLLAAETPAGYEK